MRMRLLIPLLALASLPAASQEPPRDVQHPSRVFAGPRTYRLFLPRDYATSPNRRYPVIYYFHGHSDRYTLERYDNGLDTVPKIAAFTAAHGAIVVAADGYIARDYTGFYGGNPYDIRRDGGDIDYGEYFLELVRHIDSTYRTLTSRRYRATSGLSMGGFASLYLSARYPDLVGSASAFNPGPEFYAGEKGRRSLWRPKDHVLNHENTMVRLIRASGDYISQYHEETREVYARTPGVDFEYRQDEYDRHWATSIGETFEFHMRAFSNPALDVTPEQWSYTSAQRSFEVRGMRLSADVGGPALISLENVRQGGFRVRTRQWAPDGPPAGCTGVDIVTAPLYRPGAAYGVLRHSLATGRTERSEVRAGADGRLSLRTVCDGAEISFAGEGTGGQPPVLLPVNAENVLRVRPAQTAALPLRIYNPRANRQSVKAELFSAYPTVEILEGRGEWDIPPGGIVVPRFAARFTSGGGAWAHARLQLKLTYDDWLTSEQSLDAAIAPDPLPSPAEIQILDGRTQMLRVFRQRGNQGGGAATEITVTEGRGNGDGKLDPGEQATVWVRLPQGLDPFDKNTWHRAKVYSESPWVTETADLQEDKQREWTGAQHRSSVIALAPEVPAGAGIPLILDCESWSFHFTPDARYGKELLHQAFQIHRRHVFGWTWKAAQTSSSTK